MPETNPSSIPLPPPDRPTTAGTSNAKRPRRVRREHDVRAVAARLTVNGDPRNDVRQCRSARERNVTDPNVVIDHRIEHQTAASA